MKNRNSNITDADSLKISNFILIILNESAFILHTFLYTNTSVNN